MTPTRRAARPGSRGLSPAVEAVLVVPVVVLLLAVMTAGFRLWQARSDLAQVSGAAARAASQARSSSEAMERIHQVVNANPTACDRPLVSADLSGFATPVGTTADVSVTIVCTVSFADLSVPGMPGRTSVSATGTAPLDPYRKRKP
ncbi:TadE/TadG family type IV pilus assembly protein [Propionibacteriaceae bacterium G1746]|uniref:TadE/TadG family type IV pilus assembly protein n=1 Tax=Aestuariimicrobium sp. G57 TaxID=3418485 RepID=UPI003C271D9D